MSKHTAPARPTRQLLDELDALMEKMLTLPVEDDVPPRTKSDHTKEVAAPAVAAPAVAATLTLFDGTAVKRATFEVSHAPADEAESVEAEDLIDSPDDETEDQIDDQIDEEPEPQDMSRWRALTKKLQEDRVARSKHKREEEIEEEIEEEEVAANTSDEEQEERVDHSFLLPEPPPTNERNGFYEAGLTFEVGVRRWTRPFGWAVNSPQGRMVLGILGLSMWIAAAAWLVRDWMQWPR